MKRAADDSKASDGTVQLSRRDVLGMLGVLMSAKPIAGLTARQVAADAGTDGPVANHEGARDFDFLIGKWTVLHRRLKRRLVGDSEWIEFAGPASVRKILAGWGNIDECQIPLPSGAYTGATLRLFNPRTALWSIYWMDSRNPGLDPPMIGKFENGRGLFYGDDTFDGRPIRVRFIWTPLPDHRCRWEQAFSVDGGDTWETNWTMSFTPAAR